MDSNKKIRCPLWTVSRCVKQGTAGSKMTHRHLCLVEKLDVGAFFARTASDAQTGRKLTIVILLTAGQNTNRLYNTTAQHEQDR